VGLIDVEQNYLAAGRHNPAGRRQAQAGHSATDDCARVSKFHGSNAPSWQLSRSGMRASILKCCGGAHARLFTIILGSPAGDNSKMNISLSIGPVIALIAGILILIVPRLLNYIVAFYLILIGLVGLFGTGSLHLH
jgi:hypothetical protein